MAITNSEGLLFKEFEDFLRECMRDNAEVFTIVRGEITQKAEGVREVDRREYIAFHPETDVRPGDYLRGTASGDELWVVDVESEMLEGRVVQTKAYYETAAECEERLATQSPTLRIANAPTSIIFRQHSAAVTTTWDLRALEKQLEHRGGADSEDLKAFCAALRELLEHRKRIDRGALARFSALMERHSWLATPVAQALLEWAVSGGRLARAGRRAPA